jgi:hypothetical protein
MPIGRELSNACNTVRMLVIPQIYSESFFIQECPRVKSVKGLETNIQGRGQRGNEFATKTTKE